MTPIRSHCSARAALEYVANAFATNKSWAAARKAYLADAWSSPRWTRIIKNNSIIRILVVLLLLLVIVSAYYSWTIILLSRSRRASFFFHRTNHSAQLSEFCVPHLIASCKPAFRTSQGLQRCSRCPEGVPRHDENFLASRQNTSTQNLYGMIFAYFIDGTIIIICLAVCQEIQNCRFLLN